MLGWAALGAEVLALLALGAHALAESAPPTRGIDEIDYLNAQPVRLAAPMTQVVIPQAPGLSELRFPYLSPAPGARMAYRIQQAGRALAAGRLSLEAEPTGVERWLAVQYWGDLAHYATVAVRTASTAPVELTLQPLSPAVDVFTQPAPGGGARRLAVATFYGAPTSRAAELGLVFQRVAATAPPWLGGPAAPILLALLVALGLALAIATAVAKALPLADALVPLAVLALALVTGLGWALALPAWYGPDEPFHFDYVQSLAVTGHVPRAAALQPFSRDIPADVQCSYHNLGFRSNGPFYGSAPSWLPDPGRCAEPSGRAARVPAVLSSSAATYWPLYYAPAVGFYELQNGGPAAARDLAVRMFSVLLGVAAAGFAYLAAYWAFGRRVRPLAAAAAALFALQPMIAQQEAVVSNDIALIAVSAAFFWRFFRALRTGCGPLDLAWLGVLAGVAFLAKPQGIFLAALIPIAYVGAGTRPWRPFRALAVAIPALAIPLVVGAAGNLAWQGTILPSASSNAPVAGVHGLRTYVALLTGDRLHALYGLWVVQFWGDFSWLSHSLPPGTYVVIGAAILVALAGIIWAAATRRVVDAPLVVAAVSVAVVVLLIQALDAYYYRQSGTTILEGRSFLEVLPAGVVALTGGWAAWLPKGAVRFVAAGAVVAALALNLLSLGVLADAFYL